MAPGSSGIGYFCMGDLGVMMNKGHFIVLPTPITDICSASMAHMSPTDWATKMKQLERDAMTFALLLYSEDPDTFAPETRETMNRWRPRVEALLRDE